MTYIHRTSALGLVAVFCLVGLLGITTGCSKGKKPIFAKRPYHNISTRQEAAELDRIILDQPLGMQLRLWLANTGLNQAQFDLLHRPRPGHENRMYHLGKARLHLTVEFGRKEGPVVDDEFPPRLVYDGLNYEDRMSAYFKNNAEILRERTKKLDEIDKK